MHERREKVRRQADLDMVDRLKAYEAGGADSKEQRRKRRRAIRHTCRVHIAIKISSSSGTMDTWNVEAHPIKGRILDLSAEGCSVFTAQRLEIGQELKLIIVLESGAQVNTAGAVRWTKDIDVHGGYASGVQFAVLGPKDQKAIHAFLAKLDRTIGL